MSCPSQTLSPGDAACTLRRCFSCSLQEVLQSRCELLRKQSLSATFVTVAAPGGIHLLKASCYFAVRLCSCEASAALRSRLVGAPAKAITAADKVHGPSVPRRAQATCGDVLP